MTPELQEGAPPTDPNLELLWKNTLAHWDLDASHNAFLEYANESNQLVQAAVYYRGMAGDHQRGSVATKRLAAVTQLALSKLDTSRSIVQPQNSQAGNWLLIIGFVVGTGALLLYAFTR
ncbi:MAG: hypothetical protein SFV15_11520 [Polyangiaceae bacterium]|nr:hypothetical protein [Polyangiaceae bacterium]